MLDNTWEETQAELVQELNCSGQPDDGRLDLKGIRLLIREEAVVSRQSTMAAYDGIVTWRAALRVDATVAMRS
eukprot:scaffold532992_cov39-Prasinocladus_malaysianus.AAC.1